MNREEYNACMSPYVKGKDKTKEERRLAFCIGAKICSGKVKTEDEARTICMAPRLPKWASKNEESDNLPCPEKVDRALRTIVTVKDMIKSGETDKIKEPLVTILQDIHSCAPEEVIRLANDTIEEVKKTTSNFYFKGEGREMLNGLDTLSSLLQSKEDR